MTHKNTNLTTKQVAAVAGLLAGLTNEAAAGAAGVSRRTLQRWLTEPGFRSALRQAETDLVARAARTMAAGAVEAVELLRSILDDEEQAPRDRIRAAQTLLARLPDFRLAAVEQRLIELESGGHGESLIR